MIWKLTDRKDWESLEKQFDWVNDMKQVQQSQKYHAEGTVAIHTQLVLAELEKLPAYELLDEQEKELLWASALMHDVEKRSTSVYEGNGHISATGHAESGEHTVRMLLYRELPTPFAIREHIASLVRLHGLPLWWMESADPHKKVFRASLRVDTSLLCLLSQADIRGRKCDGGNELLHSIALFEAFCKEHRCWKLAKEFASPISRYRYFHPSHTALDELNSEQFKCTVTLLSGLPGMGKDHFIQSCGMDLPVVSLDDISRKCPGSISDELARAWVLQRAMEEARGYLLKGQDFIWNACNIYRKIRLQLVDFFTSYAANVKIIYVEKPYHIWREQNTIREFPLSDLVLDELFKKLEVPLLTEAPELVYWS